MIYKNVKNERKNLYKNLYMRFFFFIKTLYKKFIISLFIIGLFGKMFSKIFLYLFFKNIRYWLGLFVEFLLYCFEVNYIRRNFMIFAMKFDLFIFYLYLCFILKFFYFLFYIYIFGNNGGGL